MRMKDLRVLAYTRSGGACEHCGLPFDSGTWSLHHRLPGGIGGTKRDRDVPSNVLAIRPACHNLEPTSIHMSSQRAREAGWLISPFDHRPPHAVPVLLWGSHPVLLDDNGGYVAVPWLDAETPHPPI